MKEIKLTINREGEKEKLKSLVCYESTHDLLKQLKEETGKSMTEIMHLSLLFAIEHMEIVEE
jgi:hypothetical protein